MTASTSDSSPHRDRIMGDPTRQPTSFALAPPRSLAGGKLVLRADTVHLIGDGEELHWCFDRRGRLSSGHRGPQSFRVGLDSCVVARQGPADGERALVRLSPTEADELFDGVAEEARQAGRLLDEGRLGIEAPASDEPPSADEARRWLDLLGQRGALSYREDARRFRQIYRPVPVLPPDCYRSVVVQVSEGCVFNRCAFCTLYEGVPYRLKSPTEVERHVEQVVELLGAAMALRQHVFLGDANALLAPAPALQAALELIERHLPGPSRGGVRSFVDAFSKLPSDLGALRAAGLRRIYLGLETGHAPLLEQLGKPGTPDRAISVVHAAKRAGIEVGVIVLVGIGGRDLSDAHVQDTGRVLAAMNLSRRDTVFLSPLVLPASTAIPGGAVVGDDLRHQERRLLQRLDSLAAQVTSYGLERWLY